VDYEATWRRMQRFTDERGPGTPDEIWFLEHPPVFTQGMNGRPEHVLAPGDIPVVSIDRGGQVTYHGPGQWVLYLLVDLRRRHFGVRDLVDLIERSIVMLLAEYGIEAKPWPEAPGSMWMGRKLPRWGCGCDAAAATTGWRSMWTWTWSPSGASIPAATRVWR